jgi:glycosyltransferase involved in cell wall biosynthesis
LPKSTDLEIVVNTRLLLKDKLDGIGWFSYETLKRITRSHPEHHFVFLFDRDPDPSMIFSDNITPLVLSPQARHPVLFWIWFELSVGGLLRDLKPDLFLSPDGYLPLFGNTKMLAVIHDLNFAHYPKDVPWLVRKYYNYFFPKFAARANRIATVSQFSKQDIETTYGIASDKIDVVYNGADTNYVPLPEALKSVVRNKHTGGCPYFLFVGSLQPRKNIKRLMQAFDSFKEAQFSEIKLLIVGHRYWWTSELEASYQGMKHRQDVIFTGRLPQQELYAVVGSALALTYVPYFEGFGIPLLEAMHCDVPVITANTSSLPEIAADAALYADPFSTDSICKAMLDLVNDHRLQQRLIEAGRQRRLQFSWDITAGLLWESILQTVEPEK